MAWGERSSLVLPLGFHGPLCMHCSAAVWYFSLLAAAALGASASAGLVAPCWKFWSLAVACFNNFQKCSRFPFLAKTGFFSRVWKALFFVFFSKLFLTSFFKGFSSILEGVGNPK